MNEKIRELALQAGGFYASGFKEVGSEFCLVDDDIQKFAELIVKECIKQNKSYMINSTHRDFYLGWNDAITHCNESVKEYFGIEE